MDLRWEYRHDCNGTIVLQEHRILGGASVFRQEFHHKVKAEASYRVLHMEPVGLWDRNKENVLAFLEIADFECRQVVPHLMVAGNTNVFIS